MDEKLHRTTLRAEHISGQPGHALSGHLASDTGANANVRDQISDDQRLAMGRATVDGNLTAPEVVATHAAAGTLDRDGRMLEPFTIRSRPR